MLHKKQGQQGRNNSLDYLKLLLVHCGLHAIAMPSAPRLPISHWLIHSCNLPQRGRRRDDEAREGNSAAQTCCFWIERLRRSDTHPHVDTQTHMQA